MRLFLNRHIFTYPLASKNSQSIYFIVPAVCLIVSGGHTELHLMRGHGRYELLGRTRDDAAGEAFDKAARLLELGYPGGPVVQQAAATTSERYALPRAWLPGTYDFSFSGLKTALYHLVHREAIVGDPARVAAAAAGFQDAVVEVLVRKATSAAEECGAKSILVSGGVAANSVLRERLRAEATVPVYIPPLKFCTDNAAMIAACSFFSTAPDTPGGPALDVVPSLSLS